MNKTASNILDNVAADAEAFLLAFFDHLPSHDELVEQLTDCITLRPGHVAGHYTPPLRRLAMPTETPLEQLKAQEKSAIEQLKGDRDSAPSIYAALLDPDREPQAGDAEKLREVMNVLDLDLATVEKHAEARREALRLAGLQPEIDRIETEAHEASKKVIAEHERFRKLEREHIEKRSKLERESDGLRIEAARLRHEQSRVHNLRTKHPFAFGEEPPAPEAPQPLQHMHRPGESTPYRKKPTS